MSVDHLAYQSCPSWICTLDLDNDLHLTDVSQGDETIAEKADASLEAMRTGRIDAGDLKRLSPFSGMSFIPAGLSAFPEYSSAAAQRTQTRDRFTYSHEVAFDTGGADSWLRERDVSFLIGKGPGESSTAADAPTSDEADTVKVWLSLRRT